MKRIGYFWWGFMADERYKNGKKFSSPDGSLLHAFSIINGFLDEGWSVYRLAPNRDKFYVDKKKQFAFASFSQKQRWNAYTKIIPCKHLITPDTVTLNWPDVDVVLLEWRMKTRYNQLDPSDENYEPDYMLQELLIQHYSSKGIPIIVLDLDYLMTEEDDERVSYVLELGFKRGIDHQINIPFDMKDIDQFSEYPKKKKIAYVGNRYNRDEAFDTFFGNDPGNDWSFDVYGNWLEGDKDSAQRWPHVHFHERIQPNQMHDAYYDSIVTPLLLKEEYNKYGFMSIRIIESILFGSIPVLTDAFKSHNSYEVYTIKDQEAMLKLASDLYSNYTYRRNYIYSCTRSLREYHDIKVFMKKMLSII